MVRNALPSDIPTLLTCAEKFHAESKYEEVGLPLNLQSAADMLVRHIRDANSVVYVAVQEGVTLGAAAATLVPSFISGKPIAVELFWWVDPDIRGRGTAMALYTALEAWAIGKKAAAMTMISLGQISNSRAERMYAQLGFTPVETTWMKEL